MLFTDHIYLGQLEFYDLIIPVASYFVMHQQLYKHLNQYHKNNIQGKTRVFTRYMQLFELTFPHHFSDKHWGVPGQPVTAQRCNTGMRFGLLKTALTTAVICSGSSFICGIITIRKIVFSSIVPAACNQEQARLHIVLPLDKQIVESQGYPQ